MMIRTGKKVQKCEGGSVLRSTEKLSDGSPPQGPAAWAEAWARIRAKLREEVGDVEFRSWLRQMTLASVDGDEATITLPTRFLRG